MEDKDSGFEADKLPQSEVYRKKEVYQFPQPADEGLPLKPAEKEDPATADDHNKEENKTSKAEGLNEEKSAGNAGAFEGFEDHAKNDE